MNTICHRDTETQRKQKAAPTLKQIRASLKAEIAMYRDSYRERDGVIRDAGALHTIACLSAALRLCASVAKPS